MKRKISIGTFTLQRIHGDEGAIRLAKKLGADAIDFDLSATCHREREGSIYAKSDEEIFEYFSNLKKVADEVGIEIGQTHGRIKGYVAGEDEYNNVIHPTNMRLDCLATKALGCKICVVHAPDSMWNKDESDETMRELGYKMFMDILPFAEEFDINIASETLGTIFKYDKKLDFYGNVEEHKAMVDRVKKDSPYGSRLCYCVDTGHTNITTYHGLMGVGDAIRTFGKDMKALHMHDNNAIRDLHQPLKWGCIDWDDVFSALDEIGYEGTYSLESIFTVYGEDMIEDTAAFAIKGLRAMLKARYGE